MAGGSRTPEARSCANLAPTLRQRCRPWKPRPKPAYPKRTKNDIRIGTAGWSYKDWDGIFYPPGMS